MVKEARSKIEKIKKAIFLLENISDRSSILYSFKELKKHATKYKYYNYAFETLDWILNNKK